MVGYQLIVKKRETAKSMLIKVGGSVFFVYICKRISAYAKIKLNNKNHLKQQIMKLKGIKIAVLGVLAMFGSSAMAQDLIARQAPIDRKMRSVDSVALHRLVVKENLANPSASLYPSWNTSHVNAYGNIALPEKYEIDLRGFVMPTTSRVVTSNFGARWGRQHKGLDIKVYVGDTIRAAFSGKVRVVDYEGRGYGNYIVIRHDNGLETVYGHLSKHLCKVNQEVHAGDVIGLGGNTGRSTGSHLHFETRLLGHAINPALLFNFPMQDVTCDVYTFRRSGALAQERIAQANVEKQKSSRSSKPRFHKVHKGETLYSISRKYGMSVDELCRINGLKKNSKVRTGKLLKCS